MELTHTRGAEGTWFAEQLPMGLMKRNEEFEELNGLLSGFGNLEVISVPLSSADQAAKLLAGVGRTSGEILLESAGQIGEGGWIGALEYFARTKREAVGVYRRVF
jgi:hypothetical protein